VERGQRASMHAKKCAQQLDYRYMLLFAAMFLGIVAERELLSIQLVGQTLWIGTDDLGLLAYVTGTAWLLGPTTFLAKTQRSLLLLVIVTCALLLVAAGMSEEPAVSLRWVVRYSLVLSVLLLTHTYCNTHNQETVSLSLLIALSSYALLALWESFSVGHAWIKGLFGLRFEPYYRPYRLQSFTIHPNLLAGLMVIAFSLLLSAERTLIPKGVRVVGLGAIAVIVFGSISRNGLLALAVVVGFWGGQKVLESRVAGDHAARLQRWLAGGVVALWSTLSVGAYYIVPRVDPSRRALWEAAWRMFCADRFVGAGPALYPELNTGYLPSDAPQALHGMTGILQTHNVLLQAVAETGLLGLLVVAVWFYFMFTQYRHVRAWPVLVAVLSLSVVDNFTPFYPFTVLAATAVAWAISGADVTREAPCKPVASQEPYVSM